MGLHRSVKPLNAAAHKNQFISESLVFRFEPLHRLAGVVVADVSQPGSGEERNDQENTQQKQRTGQEPNPILASLPSPIGYDHEVGKPSGHSTSAFNFCLR
jgi:hypothetical protein